MLMFKKITSYPNGELEVETLSGSKIKTKDKYRPEKRYKPTNKVINEYRRDISNIPATIGESSDIDLYNDI